MAQHLTTETPNASQLCLRPSEERGVQDLEWSTNYLTFSFADYHDPNWMGFGPLRVLIESHIDPTSGFPRHPHRNVEIISYVTEGTLRHADSFGHEADIQSGEMQVISAGSRGMIHSETNPRDEPEAHYQLWLAPNRSDTDFAYHERTPRPEERDGQFCLYASPDGHGDSMPVNADAYVSVGEFSPDDRISYNLPPGRGAWIQVIEGAVSIDSVTLRTGDGAGVTAADPIDVSIERPSEVLLVDVGMDAA